MARSHPSPVRFPPHLRPGRLAARRRGLTLIEVATVLSVVAVLSAAAWPSMRTLIDNRRVDGAASRVASHLHLARSEAFARNRTVRLTVQPHDHGSCVLVHTGPASQCRCGAGCVSPAELLHTADLPSRSRVTLVAPAASLQFDPQLGTCTPTATLQLVGPAGQAVHQVINVLGRVRTCSPQSRVPGHAAC